MVVYTTSQRVLVGATYTVVIMTAGYLCLRYLTPSRDDLVKVLLVALTASALNASALNASALKLKPALC